MFQSFTGTSRRPRQVNLSGRSSNPFGGQHAVAAAQQDRVHRQLQRDRLQASSRIQKTWRGHDSRRRTFKLWRQIWDQQEEAANGAYSSEAESLQQLSRLMLFFSPRHEPSDVDRLSWYGTRQVTTTESIPCTGEPWPAAYSKLRRACILALRARRTMETQVDRTLLGILAFCAKRTDFDSPQEATEYYETLTTRANLPPDHLQSALLAPLRESRSAYAGLVVLLTHPLAADLVGLLKAAVNPASLSEAVAALDSDTSSSTRQRLWLLGNMIALAGRAENVEYIQVISRLLGSLADEVDFESPPLDLENGSFDREVLLKVSAGLPLNTFLREQIWSLVEETSVRNLLSLRKNAREHATIFAGYALTLLRCFPRHADEITVWLYRGPTVSADTTRTLPIAYFYGAARSSEVFTTITTSSKGVVAVLKDQGNRYKDDWTIILVYLELYSFIIKIMDDEEFIRQVQDADMPALVSFLKNLGFTLYFDAAELSTAASSNSRDPSQLATLGRHFGSVASYTAPNVESKPLLIAGLPGLTVNYLKMLTTGLLRTIYERDSRRNFLPKGHWLMTERFDMTRFIPGVVEEEESRHMIQEQDDEDREEDSADDDDDEDELMTNGRTPTTNYSRVLRTQAARERALRKASRKRYLESVAPRLEILQNMPFLIPFHTRVQIFRQFVYMDQQKRRHGFVDPDLWRQNMMFQPQNGMPPHDLLSRHHAKIKRTQEFMDAYEQFYDLGPDLKEPIQITFVDAFDMPEAGIDGGGVTKEFLTSVITQAFNKGDDQVNKFFVENDRHLLYPNPTAIEDLKLKGQRLGLRENSAEMREAVREMLKQYEFLGRIIGKCLYEGILMDVNFAGFFLKKWALTGGTGNAAGESGYRANINDLRDLDEEMYRGLMQLKHAENSEDFGLTFTVDDLIGDPTIGTQKVVEHELIRDGTNITVNNENRFLYISQLSRYRLQGQSLRQTHAFLRGLGAMIQPSWLSMFNQNELQTLIGGAAAGGIDVQDLRRNTLYGGTYVIGTDGQEHPSVQMFWDVLSNMEDEDRRKVLKFVTSTPRGPLLGFSHLNPKFSIRDSGSDENRYPTTSTCVNLLKLPMYKSERVLREKLLAAVNSGAGFDLS